MMHLRVDFLGRGRRVHRADADRQDATMRAILDRFRRQPGVVLADEVGMGKTYVALGVIAQYLVRYPGSRVLVLTPSRDLGQKWIEDLNRFRAENVPPSVGRRMTTPADAGSLHIENLIGWRTKARIWILPARNLLVSGSRDERRQSRAVAYRLLARFAPGGVGARRAIWRALAGPGVHRPVGHGRSWLGYPVGSMSKSVRRILDDRGIWPLDPETTPVRALYDAAEEIRWALIRRRLRRFSLIVVDEAHRLKNEDTKIYRSLCSVFDGQFRDMLFLTATPFQLGPEELETIMSLFSLSSEPSARQVPEQASRVRGAAEDYRGAVMEMEEAWRRLLSSERDAVARNVRAWIEGMPRTPGPPRLREFGDAYRMVREAHGSLGEVLGRWVIRNVVDRPYRNDRPVPVELATPDRLPFALLYRLIYEYQRHRRTFSAVQQLSLTSSWDALGESAVMRSGFRRSPPVAFYRSALRHLVRGRHHEHPKLRVLLRNVAEGVERGEKVLVFTSRIETCRRLVREIVRALQPWAYREALALPVDEVDRRLQALRSRATRHRDALWLPFNENYFRSVLSPRDRRAIDHDEVYRYVVRYLWKFPPSRRLVHSGKVDWSFLSQLCEWIVFWDLRTRSPMHAALATDPHGIDWRRWMPRKFSAAHEEEILRQHGCARGQLRRWIDRVIDRPSVWDPYADLLKRLDDAGLGGRLLEVREELVSALGRVLFVPEVMAGVVARANARHEGGLEAAAVRAAKRRDVRDRSRRFLEHIVSLQSSEIEEFIAGLGGGSIVSGATGRDPWQERKRHRYGFNTPFRPYVLVASETMQEGIDLHRECAWVVHYDLAWNPASIEQRVGRVDRLGSRVERLRRTAPGRNARLEIFRLFIPGTIDERMHLRVRNRERWFKFILGNRPEWEGEGDEEREEGRPLPQAFGDRLRIRLGVRGRRG